MLHNQSDVLVELLQQISASQQSLDSDGTQDDPPSHTVATAAAANGSTNTSTQVVGPSAKELESINELIQFDHVYYKVEPQEGTQVVSQCVAGNDSQSSLSKPTAKQIVTLLKAPPRKTVTATRRIKPRVSLIAPQPTVQPVVKQEPEPEVKTFPTIEQNTSASDDGCVLNINDTDLMTLGDSLEQLMDFEALLQEEGLLGDSEKDTVCPASSCVSTGEDVSEDADYSSSSSSSTKEQRLSIQPDSPVYQLPPSPDDQSIISTNDFVGLDLLQVPKRSGSLLSESGYSSDLSDPASPLSDIMHNDAVWDESMESFTELFPALV